MIRGLLYISDSGLAICAIKNIASKSIICSEKIGAAPTIPLTHDTDPCEVSSRWATTYTSVVLVGV